MVGLSAVVGGGVKSKFRKPAKTGGISYAMPNTSPRLGKSHNRNELHKLGMM